MSSMDTSTVDHSQKARRIARAIASDLSLHWITYVGVLVVFASLLGLLLFSFADVPTTQQPFYELGMASVFFGFAWYLRRQEAVYAARAMELVGGMTLPLVLFAGFVDDAPFPPDFTGSTLIVVMVVTALGLSVIYRIIASSNAESVLGYLVAPLWWLAAMVAGFFFKTDETLSGDAITRLVTEQPALAAIAVAVSVVAIRSDWVAKPAMVAVPAAYLLTLALGAGESWDPTAALLAAGLATLVSTEALAAGTRAARYLPTLRPFLAALVLLPLIPTLETAVFGAVMFLTYLLVHEVTSRTQSSPAGLMWTRAGVVAGALLTWNNDWLSLTAFSLLTVWALVRLGKAEGLDSRVFEIVAAVAPLGIANALLQLLPRFDAFAVMAGIVAVAAVAATRTTHLVLRWWPTTAAAVIAILVLATAPPVLPVSGVAALVATGLVLALTDRASMIRFWSGGLVLVATLGSLFPRFPTPTDVATLTFAVTGGAIVVGSVFRQDRIALNVSYYGLLLTVAAGTVGGPGWTALALGLVTVRAAVSASLTAGITRTVNQVVAALTGAGTWIFLIRWTDPTPETAIEATALFWGAVALTAALAGRVGRVRNDWVWSVGGVSIFMVAAVSPLSAPLIGYQPGIAFPIGIALLAAAVEVSAPVTDRMARLATPPIAVAAWLAGLQSLQVGFETGVWTTAIAASLAALALVEVERVRRSELVILTVRLSVLALVSGGSWMASLALRTPEVGVPVSMSIAMAGVAVGRLATPLDVPTMRLVAGVLWIGSILNLGWTGQWSGRDLAVASAITGAVAVFAYLVVWYRDRETTWSWPLVGVALIADFVAVGLAMSLFPDQSVGVAVSLSIAAQALAAGTVLNSPGLLAVAPPAAAAGFLSAVGETLTSHVSWWTIPLGLVGLAEIEILRLVRRRRDVEVDSAGIIVLEALSAAVVVLPILASLFTDGLAFAALGLAAALAGMVWGVVTRMRRRFYGAAGVALVTAVLTLVAAAAGSAPESVGFWVTGAGIGMTVLLVAGYVEAYRNRRGQLIQRVDSLMAGWN